MNRPLSLLLLLLALLLSACSTSGSNTPTTGEASPTAQARVETVATAEPTAAPVATETQEPAATPTEESTAEAVGTEIADPEETATAGPQPTSRPSSTGATSEQDVVLDKLAEETSELRGLPIKKEIQEDYLTREQLRERLAEDFRKDYPVAESDAEERLLKAFGLVSRNTDLRQLYLDLYGEQVAGFYDPKTDEMYVISSGRKLNALGELTYVHEVTHALQDQSFDLHELTERYKNQNDDATLATLALIEGDATVAQIDYLRSQPIEFQQRIVEAIQEDQTSTAKFDEAPPIIRETFIFPYQEGEIFVTRLRDGGDFDAVDRAYKDPPTSTEQILHPEKYLENRDEPTEVELPALAPALGADWKKLEENLFGELQTRILLEGEGEAEQARDAAEGWDGDRYALYGNGDQDIVVWQSVWDSEQDAEEFVSALREYDEARFNASYSEEDGTLALVGRNQVALIRREGDRVSYTLAPDDALAEQALDAISR